VLKWMLDDLVKNALCCYGCMEVWWDSLCCCYSWLEIWFGLHCAAMDVWRYGLDCFVLLWMFVNLVCTALYCYGCCSLDGFVLLQMLRDLVCTALCCYGYKNISFGSSVWILWMALCCYKCWGIWFGML